MFLDLKGEKALDAIADLIEPIYEIMNDKEIVKAIKEDRAPLFIVSKMIREHKEETLKIVRILNCEDESFEPSIADLIKTFIEFKNHEVIASLFTSQGQTDEKSVSGSATDNTTE